jgi:hypothetical protein
MDKVQCKEAVHNDPLGTIDFTNLMDELVWQSIGQEVR